jgi:hypothetical protein
VTRLVDEDARDQVRALAGIHAYTRARQQRKRVERVFGHVKRNPKLQTLKLRGLAGASEEFTMAAVAYNLPLLASRAARPEAEGSLATCRQRGQPRRRRSSIGTPPPTPVLHPPCG